MSNLVSQASKKIGILGGTFDPIHYGHLCPALEVAKTLNLDFIDLLPAHIPPHKTGTIATSSQRLEMVKLVCQALPQFKADNRELNRSKPSYTFDTLTELHQEQPNCQLFFLIGMDSLLNLPRWHQWQQLLKLCNLVVTERPGYQLADACPIVEELVQQQGVSPTAISPGHGQIIFIANQQLAISSTELRQLLSNTSSAASKQQVQQYLPELVYQYIVKHQLYTQTT